MNNESTFVEFDLNDSIARSTYKVSVNEANHSWRRFENIDDACDYANRVFKATKRMPAVIEEDAA